MTVEIIRVEVGLQGSFGVLLINGEAFCCSLELPWRKNKRMVSSIPVGAYTALRRPSPLVNKITKGKWTTTFEIMDIPGRGDVLIHAGNSITDTLGCVLIGASFYKLKNDRGISNSGATFDQFMTAMRDVNEFQLTIRDVDLTPIYPVG